MSNSATLKEVAALAHVSIGTASSALNNRPSVAAETRARVLDAAISLGYPVKQRELEPCETNLEVIGLLVKHDVGLEWNSNPFYSRIQLGVANACRRNHINLMFANIEVDPSNHPVSWPAMIDENRIDGLILAGAFIDGTVAQIRRKVPIPIVLVDSYAPNLSCDSIVTDNVGGVTQAVQHLYGRGHRRIGLVGWNPDSPPSIHERHKGYLQSLHELGLEAYIMPGGLNRDAGYHATRQLLTEHPEITAIFACNDDTALGVMSAARDLNLQVPHDLSVIGFDDIDIAAEITPALTTIHVHKSWMGTMSVQALIERARSPHQPKITTVVSTHLVERETVSDITP